MATLGNMFICVNIEFMSVYFHLRIGDVTRIVDDMSMHDILAHEPDKASGWRGSRELWLTAAKQALLETGLDAVKIQPLASRLNISRTSIYWFFKDRGALLDALLEEWDAKNTGAFADASDAYAETITEAILNLIAVFHDEALFEP